MRTDTLHLKAPKNWINDPNGFIYYKGEYHLFYQYFPYAPVWGTMHWGHAVSRDLINWEHQEIAIFPTKEYDQNGIFSGSSIEKDGKLLIYYSAVRYVQKVRENIHVAEDDQFECCQAMITSEDGYRFDNWKDKKQIIPVATDDEIADATHTRDPKVWRRDDTYYMILGSTYKNKTGRVLFYKSSDGVTWDYMNQCRNQKYGTIIECPDIFKVGSCYVFLGCPMNMMMDGLECTQHAVCTPAAFEEECCRLTLPDCYQFVDYGLDLYAPQTTVDQEGKRVMIGWMRMPQAVRDMERGEWNGMMCSPRVVEVLDGHIYFRVHQNTERYFSLTLSDVSEVDFERPFRLKTTLQQGEILNIGGYQIFADAHCIKTDRTQVFGNHLGYRLVSCTPVLKGGFHLDIFVEPNLIEIFVNGGEYVLSHVVYGLGKEITGRIELIQTGR